MHTVIGDNVKWISVAFENHEKDFFHLIHNNVDVRIWL